MRKLFFEVTITHVSDRMKISRSEIKKIRHNQDQRE